jgi:hypothetical protein
MDLEYVPFDSDKILMRVTYNSDMQKMLIEFAVKDNPPLVLVHHYESLGMKMKNSLIQDLVVLEKI